MAVSSAERGARGGATMERTQERAPHPLPPATGPWIADTNIKRCAQQGIRRPRRSAAPVYVPRGAAGARTGAWAAPRHTWSPMQPPLRHSLRGPPRRARHSSQGTHTSATSRRASERAGVPHAHIRAPGRQGRVSVAPGSGTRAQRRTQEKIIEGVREVQVNRTDVLGKPVQNLHRGGGVGGARTRSHFICWARVGHARSAPTRHTSAPNGGNPE